MRTAHVEVRQMALVACRMVLGHLWLLQVAASSPPPPLADALWPRPQKVQEKTSHGGAAVLYNDWIIAYDTTNYNDTFAATELRNFLLQKTNQSLSLPLVRARRTPSPCRLSTF